MTTKKYRINDPRAISEQLDGETIIINLDTGTYYSMNSTGSAIWALINQKKSVGEIIAHHLNTFSGDPVEIERSIADLVNLLATDNLIVEILEDAPTEVAIEVATITSPSSDSSEMKPAFLTPKLDKYEDMQEMLLADPIHEVAAEGWPKLKNEY